MTNESIQLWFWGVLAYSLILWTAFYLYKYSQLNRRAEQNMAKEDELFIKRKAERNKAIEENLEIRQAFEMRSKILAILIWSPMYKSYEKDFWTGLLKMAESADNAILGLKVEGIEHDSLVEMVNDIRERSGDKIELSTKFVS